MKSFIHIDTYNVGLYMDCRNLYGLQAYKSSWVMIFSLQIALADENFFLDTIEKNKIMFNDNLLVFYSPCT